MQIKIEIDVKPEELRRFLGLPDVAGLQEDLVNFLREKLGAATETFDPASFVKDNLQTLKQSTPWQLLVSATKKSPPAPAAKSGKSTGRSRKSAADSGKAKKTEAASAKRRVAKPKGEAPSGQ